MRHCLAALLLLVFVLPCKVAAEKIAVSVPVSLDFPLLQQLLVRQLFTGPGYSREVLADAQACNSVVLTEARITGRKADVQIQARLAASLGLSVFDRCFKLTDWRGSVGFLGRPVIRPGGTAMGLEPQGIWLSRSTGEKVTSGRLWDYAQQPLLDLFSSFTVDLSPLTSSLGSLLPSLLPNQPLDALQNTLDSLQLAAPVVLHDRLRASLEFAVERVVDALPVEAPLSPEELQAWELRWQTMDALLVFAVKHYADATRKAQLRSTLLDILIDSRYQMVDALAEPVDRSNDPVRAWFVASWKQLSPVVRSIALEDDGDEALMWVSVLAATDALYALDQLGPQIGFDISADGLRRLARMLNETMQPEDLLYDESLDPRLQQLFEEQLEPRSSGPAAWRFDFRLVSPAYAADSVERLNLWVPRPDEVGEYLPLVEQLLEASSRKMLGKYKLDKAYHGLFRKLVRATAWQESCWRQFEVRDEKIMPLTSSTNDVGIMQMNERVWRGFYDLQKLRWDIAYNSDAGAEVLMDYLVKYAIRRNEHKQPGGINNLARASYSAYNGGPSKSSRYRSSNVPDYFRQVDSACWNKYQKVEQGGRADHRGIARCLGGTLSA